ncbi:Tn3 family transposase [Streptomyces sp. NPDC002659]|uniref:Tn3 family transposase n=1 Tax=Streptomyces sp. NPDC002659 TaxID=3364656 RepID=UPI0036910F68
MFSRFMPCGVWEAVYLIDSLLANESASKPERIHPDTQNQLFPVFGLAHMLGIDLLPRIRNWHDLTFHRPDPSVTYTHIDTLFSADPRQAVDWDLIERHWPDLMQAALSVKEGTVSSVTLLRRLGDHSRKNSIHGACRELGRAQRTIVLLRYLSDPALREQIARATNKAESYNGFTKWLAFGNHGTLTSRDPERQEKSIKFLDLVASSVIFSTAMDMTAELRKMAAEGRRINPADLAVLSPHRREKHPPLRRVHHRRPPHPTPHPSTPASISAWQRGAEPRADAWLQTPDRPSPPGGRPGALLEDGAAGGETEDVTETMRGLWEREAESAAVAGVLKDVTQGGGGLLLVEGPAGIGKTRLLKEVRAAAAEAGGARVVSARGTPLERDFAFGVVRQLFEPLLARADPAEREALWPGPAAQAGQVFETFDPATGPAGDFAVLHGLYWLTINASQDHPLVLLVDDLQWCDTPSLRYLAYLLPRIEDQGVLVAAALRTGESATDERLLQQITADPNATVLRPHPLSAHATALLLEHAMPDAVDPRFAGACHEATGGNPLLLRELARTLTAENIRGSAANTALVQNLGSRAVARLVALRMARLPEATVALARAAAVLGGNADLVTAAALADQDITTALEGATALERLQILRAEQHGTTMRLAFIHPLVQAAVHDSIDLADLATAHQHAARLLTAAGADLERIAAHLLHTPPTGDPHTVTALRDAATAATRRGAPEGAYTYLRRALTEPPADDQHLQVLTEAGRAALLVDLPAATGHLQQALDQTPDPAARADIATLLGTAYVYLLKTEDGLSVFSQALAELPDAEEDRRRHLQAGLIALQTWFVPGRTDLPGVLDGLRRLPPHNSVGGRLLELAVANHDMATQCDPDALHRGRRAIADGVLVEEAGGQASGDPALTSGWNILWAADDDAILDILQTVLQHAHRHGSLYALVPVYTLRSCCWLDWGRLAEAEHDAREALRTADLTGVDIARFFAATFLAGTLTEQGRLEEAEQVLHALGVTSTSCPPGPVYFALAILARLAAMRGDRTTALDAALRTKENCDFCGIRNPSIAGWRTEAALALHALDRDSEARDIAAEELELARRWGAPRALGRALRTTGLLTGGDEGLALLQEAVSVLENSPAQLEHAKALTDLGAALRRAGHRTAARDPLRRALDLATQCGATPMAEQARTELAAVGGRPRHTALTGPDALTPSEQRVADLAATGATNRQIAQQLFVTPKTVEVHLSAAYRKLGITTRTQLPAALTTS